jgi:hypothetical protein
VIIGSSPGLLKGVSGGQRDLGPLKFLPFSGLDNQDRDIYIVCEMAC